MRQTTQGQRDRGTEIPLALRISQKKKIELIYMYINMQHRHYVSDQNVVHCMRQQSHSQ